MRPVLTILCSLLVIALVAGSAAADYTVGDWTVIQLTDNNVIDANPRVSGNTVVWNGQAGASGTQQVFMWQDGVITQLTDYMNGVVYPRIDGDWITWSAGGQIFYYDGITHLASSPGLGNSYPEVSQGHLAWLGTGGHTYNNVHYFDGTDDIQVTATTTSKYDVRISGSKIVWYGDGSTSHTEIFYYDGATVFQLTDNDYNDNAAQISDGGPGDLHITYEAALNGFHDVMHFDGTTTVNLTNTPTINEYSSRTCGNRTVWIGGPSGALRVWLYDGVTSMPVSDAGVNSVSTPEVSDSLVVWNQGYWGDFYVYDGSVTTKLNQGTNLAIQMASLDGGTIVWAGKDGGPDYEIFMAYKTPPASPVPEAGNLVMAKAHPNPFNPATEITFAVDQAAAVSVKIFDMRGHLVADLGKRTYDSGNHSVTWRGQNRQGQAVPAGVYFYAVETGRDRQMGKVTLVE